MRTDIHRHLPAGLSLQDSACGAGVQQAVVQAGPEDRSLLERWPQGRFSVGLHPWDIPDSAEETRRLMDGVALLAGHPAVRLIGETGLDSMRRRFVSDAAFGRQAEVLAAHARLADAAGKPLLLHVVRRHDEMLRLHRAWHPAVPWIVHGFARNAEWLARLMDEGLLVSFGAALRSSPQVAVAWQQADLQRVFLETDDSGVDVSVLLTRAAALRGMTPDALARRLEANAAALGV